VTTKNSADESYNFPIKITCALSAISWLFLSCYTPPSILWRDSGEFIIQATYMDVAHPAGFPLYGQLAHLFYQLPFGPIAWRVHLFSTFLASISLGLAFALSKLIVEKELRLKPIQAAIVSLIPVSILFFSTAFLRQALIAEVYILNFLIIEILCLLVHRWWHTNDSTILLCAFFIAGIGLTNHLSLTLCYALLLIPLLLQWSKIKKLLLPGLLLFLLPLLIYFYIPIRAEITGPLNTGMAVNWQRFVNLVTNERSWSIEKGNKKSELGVVAYKNAFHILESGNLNLVSQDIQTLKAETSPALLFFGLIGAILFVYTSPFLGSSLSLVALSTWIFFAGWQPDPWLPILLWLGISSAIFVGKFSQVVLKNKDAAFIKLTFTLALVALIIFGSIKPNLASELATIKDYSAASAEGRSMLKNASRNSHFMTEPSLFLLLYTTAIEGFRDDVEIVYLLDLYYPEHFNQKTFLRSDGQLFSSTSLPLPHEPNLTNLNQYISFVTKTDSLELEPVTLISEHLKEVVQLEANGLLALKNGQLLKVDDAFSEAVLKELERLIRHFYESPKLISQDVVSRIELRAMLYADLFYTVGRPLRSVQILKLLCDQPHKALCFAPVEHNLKVYQGLLYDKGNKEDVTD